MQKIKMSIPIVELDGDEMTRIMWGKVKDRLLHPFIDLKVEYYDLGLKNRDKTNDQVTIDSAEAIKKYGVGVKCATITPNDDRIKEYSLKKKWKSPNATIRASLDGTVFRAPIITKNINPSVNSWKKPIVIGRHGHGDVYSAQEIEVKAFGKAEIVFTSNDGVETRKLVKEFKGDGIVQAMFNLDSSITSFAKSCFTYAYDNKIDLWFSTKDTISQVYDKKFRDVFEKEFNKNWKTRFEEAKIRYNYSLIDDAVAQVMKSEGGFLWALKNYDGDVQSDMVASAFGSLAMMTSVLVSPDGKYEFEAAHGTVQRHYYKHLKGEKTSTNPAALIFAWSGALKKRGLMDNNKELVDFAKKLETAVIETIESGIMTGDLLRVATKDENNKQVNTNEFIEEVANKLDSKKKI